MATIVRPGRPSPGDGEGYNSCQMYPNVFVLSPDMFVVSDVVYVVFCRGCFKSIWMRSLYILRRTKPSESAYPICRRVWVHCLKNTVIGAIKKTIASSDADHDRMAWNSDRTYRAWH